MSEADEIKKLKKLFDEDAITEEEYNSQKDKLLNSKIEKNERSFIGKVFKYLFYAYNGIMAFWLISGLFSAGSDILNETNEYAAAGGAINAFELPARMSYYPLLINKDAMPSAVAMNSMTWQGTRVIAPAIAGLLIALFGGTTTLLICCVCFLLMIFFLNLTHVDISKLKQKGNPLQDIIDGLLFIYKNKLFLTIIGYSFFIGFFGWVYLTMMPYMAVQVLKVDSSGTGILMTSAGMGAVIPTVIFARAGINDRRMGISAGSFFSGISILLFAFTAYQFQSFYITMFFVFLIGLFSSVYMLSAISTIQLNVPNQLRGRIMGIYTITYSIISLGGLYSGLVGGFLDRLLATDHIGVPISIGLGGIIVVIGSICIYLFNESLKKEI